MSDIIDYNIPKSVLSTNHVPSLQTHKPKWRTGRHSQIDLIDCGNSSSSSSSSIIEHILFFIALLSLYSAIKQ